MSGESRAEQFAFASQQLRTRQLGAVPLVLPILEDLGLCACVNRLRPSKSTVDYGRIAVLMALNRTLSPRPLSGVPEWAQGTVVGDLLGVASEQLYDMRLGRALDAIFPGICLPSSL